MLRWFLVLLIVALLAPMAFAVGNYRLTESGNCRITEAGDFRITEDSLADGGCVGGAAAPSPLLPLLGVGS
jgi:hypothetical protein